MKRNIVDYLEGSFVDFEGKEHRLVACAVSMTPEITNGDQLMVGWKAVDNYMDRYASIYSPIKRLVVVAIAVCNPCDEYDLEKGKKIAYHKALNGAGSLPTLYSDQHGVISKALVATLLRQELLYAQNSPEKLIKGYLEAKAKYEEQNKLDDEISNLSQPELAIVELLASDNIEKYQKLAKKMKSKIENV